MRLFLGPGFQLGARWNRLSETVKTRKKRENTGKKWARYGLKRAKESGSPGWKLSNTGALAWPVHRLDFFHLAHRIRATAKTINQGKFDRARCMTIIDRIDLAADKMNE